MIEPIVVRYGPDAPPIAEQLGYDPSEEACETAQMVLDGITQAFADGNMTPQSVRKLRQEVTESLIRRLDPETVISGRSHYDKHGNRTS